jgi:hypothetical protein
VPEKLSILQTSLENRLVGLADEVVPLPFAVDDRNEPRHQFAVVGPHGKKLLVFAHGRDDHFRRQGEISWIEVARDGLRRFDEVIDVLQQALILNQMGPT